MITIETSDDDISRVLDRITHALTDMSPVMHDIGQFLMVSTKDRFEAGESPDGMPWAPKSQTTIDIYTARHDPVDPRPLFGPSSDLSRLWHFSYTRDSVELATATHYAAVMQFGADQGAFGATAHGAPIPWGDIPARPFLGLSEDDRAGIAEAVYDRIGRLVDEAG